MEPNLFKYIWRHTKRQQLVIILLVLVSMPAYFVVLELPKRIINGPIAGEGFTTAESTVRYLEFGLPEFLVGTGPGVTLFGGFELTRLEALFLLTFLFLFFVIVSGLLKYVINTYKGILGERMLRRIRYELMDMLLRFPVKRVRDTRGTEVASMVKDEVEPLGGFIGDSIASPIFNGSMALTALAFILIQNFFLGLIALGMVVVTTAVIPPLRRRLIDLARQRQLTARQLAGRVGEIVDGIEEIRVNDASYYERSDIIARLGKIFKIRFDIYRWKFFVKFLNNFLAQVTPFLFYLIGGFFVIQGQMDIGQLVAVIAAYRDLPPPIKEIINWDQRRLDVHSKYEQVVSQFHVTEPLDEALQPLSEALPAPLDGKIEANHVIVRGEGRQEIVKGVTLQIDLNERVLLVGDTQCGADVMVEAMAGLRPIDQGSLTINGKPIIDMPDNVRGAEIAYVSTLPYFARSSIGDVMTYGLKRSTSGGRIESASREIKGNENQFQRYEARMTGQPYFAENSNWIDASGLSGEAETNIDDAVFSALEAVGLDRSVYEIGIRALIDEKDTELVEALMEMRRAFQVELQGSELKSLIESFRPDHYHNHSTILQNIIFGSVVKRELLELEPEDDPEFRELLARNGTDKLLFTLGYEIVRILAGLLGGVTTNLNLLHRLNLFSEDELQYYRELLNKYPNLTWESANDEVRTAMLIPAMRYKEPAHRFGLLEPAHKKLIVETRKNFQIYEPTRVKEAIQHFDPDRYDFSESVSANLIFGRLASQRADAEKIIAERLFTLLEKNDLLHKLVKVGLQKSVGNGGQDLSQIMRQRLSLARGLIKKPQLVMINNALSSLGRDQFAELMSGIKEHHEGGVIWAMPTAEHADHFDRTLVFQNGNLVDEKVNGESKVTG